MGIQISRKQFTLYIAILFSGLGPILSIANDVVIYLQGKGTDPIAKLLTLYIALPCIILSLLVCIFMFYMSQEHFKRVNIVISGSIIMAILIAVIMTLGNIILFSQIIGCFFLFLPIAIILLFIIVFGILPVLQKAKLKKL